MTAPEQPPTREVEAVPVSLARMEGKLDLVFDRVSGLITRVERNEVVIAALTSTTQQLASDASAAAKALVKADEGREFTARALKDADTDRVAAAKEKVDQSNAAWTPAQRIGGFLVGLAVIASMAINITLLMRGGK